MKYRTIGWISPTLRSNHQLFSTKIVCNAFFLISFVFNILRFCRSKKVYVWPFNTLWLDELPYLCATQINELPLASNAYAKENHTHHRSQ